MGPGIKSKIAFRRSFNASPEQADQATGSGAALPLVICRLVATPAGFEPATLSLEG
jgi:hypothetical protein